ncbi:alpha/beta-hydrolase [Meira miltonrushii]|uniref:Alpha/beta-hydrolase n=1 Tax=Meira miltonrushii TaxID=1280837 RepID=A0A316V8M9_9BASI|nr:alpha/beta-hydrolase [Meira miltonrushii]PWN32841.1 alpha/beta-hydrolase [Meira miltonrushii]
MSSLLFKNFLSVWLLWSIVFQIQVQSAPISANNKAPSFLAISEADKYASIATFAADAYCTGLQIGSKVGNDGKVFWKAGDGTSSQMVFIAHSPTAGIVVAHQGTNTSAAASVEHDIRINQVSMHTSLTKVEKKVTGGQQEKDSQPISVAAGFQNAWLQTSDEVLKQVESARQKYPNATITITGHSLGAAIALFDALAIQNQFKNATLDTVVFGMPRVGNQQFANMVDEILPNQKHIINKRDPVPHLPFQALGFRQASGEIWIQPSNLTKRDAQNALSTNTVSCPGQENPDCSDTIHFGQFDLDDHDGPYFGVEMQCSVQEQA